MFVRGRCRGGVGRLGETAERGALRAGMWRLLGESYVRTENERQACQQGRQRQGPGEAGTGCAPKWKKKHEQKFCRGDGSHRKHATTTAAFRNRARNRKRKRVRETRERFLAIPFFLRFRTVSFPSVSGLGARFLKISLSQTLMRTPVPGGAW